jgi:2-succinyl-6-hydroxy-2,4-cyclohexadiene-1-carboxylate synthase
VNRVDLFPEAKGAGDKLILLHGFTQTLRSWDIIAADLRQDFRVLTVDAPGHGLSDQVRVDLPTAALLYAATLARGTYIGYSMGARLALHVALEQPFVVERLVLLGGTAGLESDDERHARRVADEALADAIERDGVAAFLDRWLAQPMFASVPDDRADRLRNSAAGLATSLRLTGTGAQDNLWGRLQELQMPVLVMVGEDDEKFTDIGYRMVAAVGDNATFATVPNAAHAAHLEQPSSFLAVLREWLNKPS